MGKNMARVKNGVVVNLEWVDDSVKETEDLKDTNSRLIDVGDKYISGKFYRNNTVVLSREERLLKLVSDYEDALSEILAVVSAPIGVSETEVPTIESRKQVILNQIDSIRSSFDRGEECIDG